MAAATSSTTSSSLVVALLCAAAACCFFSAADAKAATIADGNPLVTKTCADIVSHDWGWLPDNACESTLRQDKRSAAAKTPRDLALIAMDLAQRGVADADAKVDAALRSSAAGHLSNDKALALRHCRLEYAAVASAIPVCRAMVHDYKEQAGAAQGRLAPSDYLECVRRLRRGAAKCWFRAVVKTDVEKRLFKEIGKALSRIELVAAMLEEMLGIVIEDHYPPQWL